MLYDRELYVANTYIDKDDSLTSNNQNRFQIFRFVRVPRKSTTSVMRSRTCQLGAEVRPPLGHSDSAIHQDTLVDRTLANPSAIRHLGTVKSPALVHLCH